MEKRLRITARENRFVTHGGEAEWYIYIPAIVDEHFPSSFGFIGVDYSKEVEIKELGAKATELQDRVNEKIGKAYDAFEAMIKGMVQSTDAELKPLADKVRRASRVAKLKLKARTLSTREITQDEIVTINDFKGMLKLLKDYTQKRSVTEKDFNELKEQVVTQYDDYDFAKPVLSKMGEITDSLKAREEYQKTKQAPDFSSQHSTLVQQVENALLSGNIDEAFNLSQQLKTMNDSYSEANVSDEKIVQFRNPFEIAGAMIFFSGGKKTGLIDRFEAGDMEEVIKKDISKFRFTFLPLNKEHLGDFENIVYFIQNLRETNGPADLKRASEIRDYVQYTESTRPEYKTLTELVDKYLHGNDKKLIPHILELLKQFPVLNDLNEEKKAEIKTVYRGIPDVGHEDEKGREVHLNQQMVLDKEKKEKFVATSKTRYSAENFAKNKGHLDANAHVPSGWVLVYAVTPNDIVLDTDVFGGIFGESEVLINAQTATLEDIELEDWEDYEGGD